MRRCVCFIHRSQVFFEDEHEAAVKKRLDRIAVQGRPRQYNTRAYADHHLQFLCMAHHVFMDTADRSTGAFHPKTSQGDTQMEKRFRRRR